MDGQQPEEASKQEIPLQDLAGELLPHEVNRVIEGVELHVSYDLKKRSLVARVGIAGIPFWKLLVYLSVLTSAIKYLWE